MTSNLDDTHKAERQALMTRLLDAVKQCQIRFGGKTELATENDSRVCCLCAMWEAVIQHGMKHSKRALSTLKQVSEITGLAKIGSGLSLIGDLKNMETEPVFWYAVKELLNKHEAQRFQLLKVVDTDAGRGRAWLRSTLNEHSLEKFLHLLLDNTTLLSQYFEEWSLLRDPERSSMLPNMAAGLGSILFAISIDNNELNTIKPATGLDLLLSTSPPTNYAPNFATRVDEEPRPVIAGDGSPTAARKRDKKRKKKFVNIVSFDEDDNSSTVSSSVTSPMSLTCPVDFSIPSSVSGDASTCNRDDMDIKIIHARSPAEGKQGEGHLTSLEGSVTSLTIQTISGPKHSHNEKGSRVTGDNETVTFRLGTEDICVNTDPAPQTKMGNPSLNTSELSQAPSLSLSSASSSSFPPKKAASLSGSSGLCAIATTSHLPVVINDLQTNSETKLKNTKDQLKHTDSTESTGSSKTMPSDISDLPNSYSSDILVPLNEEGQSHEGGMVSCVMSEDTASYDSSELMHFSEDTQYAAEALVHAQKGFLDSQYQRTDGDGSYAPEPTSPVQDTMTTGELKQAVITMMMRKDEVELQNRTLQAALLAEADVTSMLRLELEEMRKTHLQQRDKDSEKIRALGRENELLKHQLKKYVSAVQMLRRQGADDQDLVGIHLENVQPALPVSQNHIDYSHEAGEYEKKLIQVAEMHGELMEFNELLQKQLMARDFCLQRLRTEMEQLRGPLPQDVSDAMETSSVVSDYDRMSEGSRPLVNIWIPSAFLRKASTDAYHVYQVYIRIHEEEWNIYRRYTEFSRMHNSLKKKFPLVRTFEFPPKKAIGNKSTAFVEVRRRRLQQYLRRIINMLLENGSDLTRSPSRKTLDAMLPFFMDKKTEDTKTKTKIRRQQSAGELGSRGSQGAGAEGGYTGL